MTRSYEAAHVLVIWGLGCDEAAAAGFVSAFRGQGAAVTVVGVSGRNNSGAHGLTLQPDLLLSEALSVADTTDLVVIPCNVATVTALDIDPRLRDLCRRAANNGAAFVICDQPVGTLLELDEERTRLLTFDLNPLSIFDD